LSLPPQSRPLSRSRPLSLPPQSRPLAVPCRDHALAPAGQSVATALPLNGRGNHRPVALAEVGVDEQLTVSAGAVHQKLPGNDQGSVGTAGRNPGDVGTRTEIGAARRLHGRAIIRRPRSPIGAVVGKLDADLA